MKQLLTGVAYHGNRILKHVEEDMIDIVQHNMNLVVHMFTHNDWDRHLRVMKDIVNITKYYGLDMWIDNWGIGGPPGDKSFFTGAHPETRMVYSDGTIDPVRVCFNRPELMQFTKDWVYTVKEFGGEKILWDEPHLPPHLPEMDQNRFTCCCDVCQKLFREKYGKPMPKEMTDEVKAFRTESIRNYFNEATAYATGLGMENITVVMVHTLEHTLDIINTPDLHNFGIDPYWDPKAGIRDPYAYVYTHTKNLIDIADEKKKDCHVWIQGFDIPAGKEDELILATDAAFDAGARTILDWSYRGAESNSYKADNAELVWRVMGEAMGRIRNRYFDQLRVEKMNNL